MDVPAEFSVVPGHRGYDLLSFWTALLVIYARRPPLPAVRPFHNAGCNFAERPMDYPASRKTTPRRDRASRRKGVIRFRFAVSRKVQPENVVVPLIEARLSTPRLRSLPGIIPGSRVDDVNFYQLHPWPSLKIASFLPGT